MHLLSSCRKFQEINEVLHHSCMWVKTAVIDVLMWSTVCVPRNVQSCICIVVHIIAHLARDLASYAWLAPLHVVHSFLNQRTVYDIIFVFGDVPPKKHWLLIFFTFHYRKSLELCFSFCLTILFFINANHSRNVKCRVQVITWQCEPQMCSRQPQCWSFALIDDKSRIWLVTSSPFDTLCISVVIISHFAVT